jgi:hypothetical protein
MTNDFYSIKVRLHYQRTTQSRCAQLLSTSEQLHRCPAHESTRTSDDRQHIVGALRLVHLWTGLARCEARCSRSFNFRDRQRRNAPERRWRETGARARRPLTEGTSPCVAVQPARNTARQRVTSTAYRGRPCTVSVQARICGYG